MQKKADRPFLIIVLVLVIFGVFIFLSASSGLLANTDKGEVKYYSVMFNQLVFGLGAGVVACLAMSVVHFSWWRKLSFWIFLFSFLAMLAVFIPGLGFYHGGARRWVSIGSFTFQPAEFYKLGFVMYLATLLTATKNKVNTFKYGTLPFLVMLGISAGLILMQPDTDTFIVVAVAGTAMFISAGGRWKHVMLIGLAGVVGLICLVFMRPYLMQRVKTFIDPSKDPRGSSYQIEQSLIAIGSGGVFGRGFGQSVQKFNFLPEPIGDSIFAVASEEFGFVGSLAIIMLYLMFTFQGFRVAIRSTETYGSILAIGIIVLISLQSFLNIAAMLAIIPLSGTPLLFISHGGTALFFALASVGIVINISRFQKKIV
ncbi:MAG: putative peptidoglycan glycosyltransferase FtsW [bacterium]